MRAIGIENLKLQLHHLLWVCGRLGEEDLDTFFDKELEISVGTREREREIFTIKRDVRKISQKQK